ncbi:MAG: transporter substrate-binding domain-containing protein [Gammaproteobacteria bacterium]|nr:transporter substrate-binding domain-containing protein [Gammaproteobacteria bacterium]
MKDYAREADRELAWVVVDNRWDLLPALQAGRGDLIAGQDESIVAGMANQAEFTLPWTMSRQRIVGRRGSQPLAGLDDLRDRQVAVKQNSPAYGRLVDHARGHAGMNVISVPENRDTTAILHKVQPGTVHDLAVVDSGSLSEHMPNHPELNILLDLPGGENLVWAVHPGSNDLRESMDRFLSREALSRSVTEVRFEDMPRIDERRSLRVITYQSPANYYLDDSGELRGFEYELVRKFAKRRGLRVEMVVAPSQADMVRWLLEGRGDLIAASVPAPGVRKDPRLEVSRPYNYATPLIVGRDSDKGLIDARDLEGRRLVLPAGSPHKRLLERYQQRGIGVDIVEADPDQSSADILHKVKVGIYDLTVVDSHKSRTLLAAESGARVHFPVSEPLPHGWIVRADDSQLLDAVNGFISETYRKRDYNVLHARYFEHPVKSRHKSSGNELLALGGELSPYDDLVRRYAEQFGFDWRLIVAQMYQESRFDPQALSSAGAVGLMQLLPTTASEVGITDLYKPDASIHGGVRYLSNLYQRFEDRLAFEDRVWFSLAAYNAGFHRVEQARQRAVDMDLDPDRWFDNVEKAMLTMADNTPCRCGQPVAYVRESVPVIIITYV